MIGTCLYGIILILNLIILTGWIFAGTDPIWELFKLGSPVKLYTAACFSIFSLGNILLYFSESKSFYKLSSGIIDWVKYFSLFIIGIVVLQNGVLGTLQLSSNNILFNFPSAPCLINFILISYGCRANLRWNDKARWDVSLVVFINTFIAVLGYYLSKPRLYYENSDAKIIGMSLFGACFFFLMSVINLTTIKNSTKKA